MPHSHEHGRPRSHDSAGNIGVAFFLNLSFTVIELTGGVLTNSVAIISDAVHDFGDSLSLGLSWYFQRLSKKGSTGQYTYGYKRFSLLGAIINSVVLVAGSVYILSEAVPRILAPQETNAAGMLVLAVLGIIINGAAVLRTKKASTINERVISLHLLEDVLGWAAVLAGSLVMQLTGLTVIDPVLSVLIACFVLANVFKNIRQVLPILLQGTPADIDRARIVEKLNGIDRVGNIHDLHIWSLDEAYKVLTVHIALAEALPARDSAELKHKIRSVLKEEGIQHATIEFEAPDEACSFEDCVK
ncbi:MAG: cation diffusion facilitator family transporter [Clostridiales bacterium]|jgi:cobalt-zinc-cadmium efflux system protein|nr:cation diffusion facilitator family transporter [Clostridiales bacterium]